MPTVTTATAPSLSDPVSDAEFGDIADLLDGRSPFDTDGLLGVLHAVAVAPGILPPSAWLPEVLPRGPGDTPHVIGLLLRLHNDVLAAVNRRRPLIPEEDDIEACVAFAAGYAAGAALDPLWIGDDDRWTFASCVAYLGGRRDLVPDHTLAKLDETPDAKDTLRRDLDAVVLAADESFRKVRRAEIESVRANPPRQAQRVGRNDPCPCASGKKFKRCCIDRPLDHSPR